MSPDSRAYLMKLAAWFERISTGPLPVGWDPEVCLRPARTLRKIASGGDPLLEELEKWYENSEKLRA